MKVKVMQYTWKKCGRISSGIMVFSDGFADDICLCKLNHLLNMEGKTLASFYITLCEVINDK